MSYRFNAATANPGGLYPENVFGTLVGPSQDSSVNRQPAGFDQGNSNAPFTAPYNNAPHSGSFSSFSWPVAPSPTYHSAYASSSLHRPAVPSTGPYHGLSNETCPPAQIQNMSPQSSMPNLPYRPSIPGTPLLVNARIMNMGPMQPAPVYHFPPPGAPSLNRYPESAAHRLGSHNTQSEQREHKCVPAKFIPGLGFVGPDGNEHPIVAKLRKLEEIVRPDPSDVLTAARDIRDLQREVKGGVICGVPLVPEIREQTYDRLEKLKDTPGDEISSCYIEMDKIVDDARAAHTAIKEGNITALPEAYSAVLQANYPHLFKPTPPEASSTELQADNPHLFKQQARGEKAVVEYEAERQKNAMPGNQAKRLPHMRARKKNERLFTLTDKKRTLSDGEELESAKRRTEALQAGSGAPGTKADLKRKIDFPSGKNRKKSRLSEEEKELEMTLRKFEPGSFALSEKSIGASLTDADDTVSSVTTGMNIDSSYLSEDSATTSSLDVSFMPAASEAMFLASPVVEDEFADLLWLDAYMKDIESPFNF
ncbi:hypothetical protein GGI43DRAFT_426157 [Trichoderma evansii]